MGKIRFGIAGTGRISDWVLEGAFEDERFEAVAVCSRSQENATAFAAKYGIRKTYTNIAEMAADDEVEAIYIGTPNHTHCHYALECIAAGKHVLCEKPLAANAEEAEKMIKAARERGVLLMEAVISTVNPNFRKVIDIVKVNKNVNSENIFVTGKENPKLGKIRNYFASFCQYSTKYGKLKLGEISNSFNPLSAGGAIMDIGMYTIYPMCVLFGKPENVLGNIYRYEDHELHPDIHGSALFSYDELQAQAVWSKIADSTLPTEITGEKGTLIIDKIHSCKSVKYVRRGKPDSGRSDGNEAVDISVPMPNNPYFYEFEEFINCLEAGHTESEINTLEASLNTMQILDRLREL